MSGRQDQGVRQIHPKSLALIGDEACLEMLALARDLRSGAVPPEAYDQTRLAYRCGAPCCIAGHLRRRMSWETYAKIRGGWVACDNGIIDLFASHHPSDPHLAADAIERFVFDCSDNPWKV
jgi:hypothetical protein